MSDTTERDPVDRYRLLLVGTPDAGRWRMVHTLIKRTLYQVKESVPAWLREAAECHRVAVAEARRTLEGVARWRMVSSVPESVPEGGGAREFDAAMAASERLRRAKREFDAAFKASEFMAGCDPGERLATAIDEHLAANTALGLAQMKYALVSDGELVPSETSELDACEWEKGRVAEARAEIEDLEAGFDLVLDGFMLSLVQEANELGWDHLKPEPLTDEQRVWYAELAAA